MFLNFLNMASKSLTQVAINLAKTCGPGLLAKLNSGGRCAAALHAKKYLSEKMNQVVRKNNILVHRHLVLASRIM